MSPRLSIRDISQRLADDIEPLTRKLLGEPNRSRSTRDELRFGTNGSLSIVLAGDKRGKWYDHEAGEGGDAFGLVQREIGKAGAREWALRWLGIEEAPIPVRLRLPSGAAPVVPVLPAAEEREDAACAPSGSPPVSLPWLLAPEHDPIALAHAEMRERFLGWCSPAGEDTPVARYLRRRGYTGPIPAALRDCGRPSGHDDENGEPIFGLPYYANGDELTFTAAMVAEIAQLDGTVAGVHVTYLRPDGSGKADVPSPKKMHGAKKGGAVRLTPAGPVLAVTEGIETALSILEARPDLAVWAALDAGNMKASLDLPAEVRKVLVCADNDASGAGLNAAEAAADRWLAEGREVAIALPPRPGTDFNDVLLKDGAAAIRALLERAEPCHGSERFVPHFAAEPMDVEAASTALVEAVDGFIEAEAVHVQVRRAQAAAVRDALAAHPELDPAITVSALISPIAERAHKQLVGRAKSRARRAVLAEHGLTRLPERARLQVAAGAGIGKTQAVIEAVAERRTVPFVAHYYVPTHALSEGLAERFRQAGVRAHVIRGRTATGPDGETMCRKPKLAEKVGAAGLNVKKSICKNERGPCEHYGRCPFMRQVEEITTRDAATVIIMPHSYLTQPKPEGLPAADFAVIDESPVQSLLAKATVAAEELDAPEHWSVLEGETGALANFLETGRMLRAALKGRSGTIGKAGAGLPPLSEIEQAAAFAGEVAGAGYAGLSPSMDEQEALRMLSKLKPSPRGSIARLYRLLAFETALERDVLHGIEGSGNEVRLHWRRKPKPGAEAVLIIDADADESIGRVLWGKRLRHLSLPARRNAVVTQATDATFSKSSLSAGAGWQSEKGRKTAARKLEEVRRLVRDLVALHGPSRVLVVANKPVRCALTGESGSARLPASAGLDGAAVAHFGNVRGIDTWKDAPAR